MMSFNLSKTHKGLNDNIYEKSSKGKVKMCCPMDGNVEGLSEIYVNSAGRQVLHITCPVCGWVKIQADSRVVDEGNRKAIPVIICSKCKQGFFGSWRTVMKDYENHLKEHILKDVAEGKVEYGVDADDALIRKTKRRRKK